MAEKTGNEIWDDMKNAQEALVDENLKKYKAEKDNLAVQAEANAAAESAGASADHQNYATPNGNGIQADAVSRLGLNKGKLSETNLAGGYNAYQSRLAAAARQTQNSKDQLDLAYNLYNSQTNAEKLNAQANYNAMKNSEYWKKANWDYQLAADKKAEEEARRAASVYRNDTTPDEKQFIEPVEQVTEQNPYGDGITGWWRKFLVNTSGKSLSTIKTPLEENPAVYERAKDQMALDVSNFSMSYKGKNTEKAKQTARYYYDQIKADYPTIPQRDLDNFAKQFEAVMNGG